MSHLERLYPMWREELIATSRHDLKLEEDELSRLKSKTTIYTRSIAAMADMRRKALAIYENSPETLEPLP